MADHDTDPTELRDCPVLGGCTRYRRMVDSELERHQAVMTELGALRGDVSWLRNRLEWHESAEEKTASETVEAKERAMQAGLRLDAQAKLLAEVRDEGARAGGASGRRAGIISSAVVAALITSVGLVAASYIQAHPAHAPPAASR